MTKKWIAINLMLLLGAGLLFWRLIDSVKSFDAANEISRIVPEKKKAVPEGGLPQAQAPRKYSEVEFAVIPGQNVFAESRKMDEKTEPVAPPEAPPLDIKPILKGVIVSGSQRMVMMIDPSTGNAGALKPVSKMIGDSYRGFTITDITDDKIVLELGTRREVIPLFDVSKRPTAGGKTPIIATRVVNFSPAAAGAPGGGIPVVTTLASPSPASANVIRQAQPVVTVQPAAGRGGGQRGQQGPMQAAPGMQPQGWNQSIDSQGRVVINTPFGQIPVQTQSPPATKK